MLTNWPNAGFRASVGYLWLKAGGPADGFDGNADALTVGVNGLDTTYDFEPTESESDYNRCADLRGRDDYCQHRPRRRGESLWLRVQGELRLVEGECRRRFCQQFLRHDANSRSIRWMPAGAADCTTIAGHLHSSAVTQQAPQVAVSGSGTLAKITFTGVAPGAFPVTIVDDQLTRHRRRPSVRTAWVRRCP